MEHDPRRRLELMYNQVDLYVVLALEGKLELESMRSLITHCARWQRLFSPVSLQVLHTARLHQSLSSHEDALCRTLAVSRLLARHARVRIHSYLAQALGDLLARSWRYSASVNWPRALQRELDEQLLEVLELLFRADMPAALLTLQRHNYSRLGRYLFAGQVALVIRVVALRRWLAIDHINLSLRNTISSTNTSTTLNSSNANTTITSNNNMSSLPADGSTTNISDAKLTITASKSNPDAGPDLTESLEHGSVLGDALLQSKSGISSDPSPPEVTVSPAISNVIDPPIEEKPPMLANLKTPTELQQHLQLCLQAPVSSNELPFVASLAKGFERAAKLWLRYMESQKPPSNVEELVHFSRALEQFCVGLVRIFRPPNKQGEVSDQPHHYHHYRTSSTKKGKKSHKNKRLLNEITKTAANHLQKWSSVHLRSSKSPSKSLMPETDQSMTGSCQSINNTTSSVIGSLPSSPIRTSAPASIGTLPKESEFCKTKKKKSDTLQQRWEGTWAQFESIEHRQMHLNAMFKAPLPKAIQQTLRSIHVLIDYHLCNWIPFPLKMEIERLLLPLDYSEATEQAKRNAIFQVHSSTCPFFLLILFKSFLNIISKYDCIVRLHLTKMCTIRCESPYRI